MKRILVGFDGSEGSENALNKAMMLINENGKLILIAVVPVPSDQNLVDQTAYELMKKRAHNLINNVVKDIGSHEFEVIGMVEEGDIAAKIIDTANALNCDLIVLGSKGTSELGMYPIGSVANKVVQYAHKPVMIVR
ncbi:MAG: universal stress protein [Thermoplasmatales archaeon]|nr:universal stress protein [Thermoplasmatales archaeon]